MINQVQKVETEKAPIEIRNGMVQIQSIGDAYRFAQYVVKSNLAPKSFDTPEKVMIAWQHGAELGLKPMQALQNIAVINGRPSVYGKAAAGIVINSGFVDKFEEFFEGSLEDQTLTAVCVVKRKDVPDIRKERFGIEDAKRAGLWNRKTSTGADTPWVSYPKDMLRYKARARAFAALFGDILCGLAITEDILEVPAERTSITETPAPEIEDPLLVEIEPESPVATASVVDELWPKK